MIDFPSAEYPFVISVKECQNFPLGKNCCGNLVGMSPVLDAALNVINAEIIKATDDTGELRKAPLVFSRFSRGGKTTALRCLFNKLKECGVYPIIINLNGRFRKHEFESSKDALLRVIATALCPALQPEGFNYGVNVDVDELMAFLNRQGLKIALLVDELNALGTPLDADASRILKDIFLDPIDRYLIFTTHVHFSIVGSSSAYLSSSLIPSQRKCMYSSLALETNFSYFKGMADVCENITPMEIAYFGGVPSLVYCSRQHGELGPAERFLDFIDAEYKETNFNDAMHQALFYNFIQAFLSGERPPGLTCFDRFSSVVVVGNDRRHYWPPCYMMCISNLFTENAFARALRDCFQNLKMYSRIFEAGFDWQILIEIAAMLNCGSAQKFGGSGPFGICEGLSKPHTVDFFAIPANLTSVKTAVHAIRRRLGSSTVPIIGVYTSTYAKFPKYDGFVGYYDPAISDKFKVFGYQAKLSRAYPEGDVDGDLVNVGFLMRGHAPVTEKKKRGWKYLSISELNQFLGFSLSFLYPAELLRLPPLNEGEDKFDE